MGYRELSRMEIVEVVRRWQAGESQRGIARVTGLARETVSKYLAAAGTLGLLPNGPPPERGAGGGAGAARICGWCAAHVGRPGRDALEPYAERIRSWVQNDELQLTCVQELLAQDGVRCSYMALLRFVHRAGWSSRSRSTVRLAESQPGDVAGIDYGRMGMLLNPLTGERQTIWALVVVLPFSRHCFVWLTTYQILEGRSKGWKQRRVSSPVCRAAMCSITSPRRSLDPMHSNRVPHAGTSNTASRVGSGGGPT